MKAFIETVTREDPVEWVSLNDNAFTTGFTPVIIGGRRMLVQFDCYVDNDEPEWLIPYNMVVRDPGSREKHYYLVLWNGEHPRVAWPDGFSWSWPWSSLNMWLAFQLEMIN